MAQSVNNTARELERIASVLPKLPIMPDENPAEFEEFQAGLLSYLDPNSAYQNIIAQDIVASEWEIFRIRRWLKVLITASAEEYFTSEIAEKLSEEEAKDIDVKSYAKTAMQIKPGKQQEMTKWFEDRDINLTRSLALAYSNYEDKFAHLERQIRLLENGRKRLWEDYISVRAIPMKAPKSIETP